MKEWLKRFKDNCFSLKEEGLIILRNFSGQIIVYTDQDNNGNILGHLWFWIEMDEDIEGDCLCDAFEVYYYPQASFEQDMYDLVNAGWRITQGKELVQKQITDWREEI